MTDEEPGRLFDKVPRTIEPKESGQIAEFLVDDMTHNSRPWGITKRLTERKGTG